MIDWFFIFVCILYSHLYQLILRKLHFLIFILVCPWGTNWLGTVCPERPINWGPIVRDQMSGDHMRLGPNVSQPLYQPLKISSLAWIWLIDFFIFVCILYSHLYQFIFRNTKNIAKVENDQLILRKWSALLDLYCCNGSPPAIISFYIIIISKNLYHWKWMQDSCSMSSLYSSGVFTATAIFVFSSFWLSFWFSTRGVVSWQFKNLLYLICFYLDSGYLGIFYHRYIWYFLWRIQNLQNVKKCKQICNLFFSDKSNGCNSTFY